MMGGSFTGITFYWLRYSSKSTFFRPVVLLKGGQSEIRATGHLYDTKCFWVAVDLVASRLDPNLGERRIANFRGRRPSFHPALCGDRVAWGGQREFGLQV